VIENGIIPEYLQTVALRVLDFWDLRILLPVFYYRIDRCSEKDVRAFKHFLDIFVASFPPLTTREYSDAMRYHIGLSELFSENPMSADVCEEIDATLLATEHLACNALQLLETWPTYSTDEYYHEWASEEVPILMINGTLDRATPMSVAGIARDNLTGPYQYFVKVPNAIHVVMFGSPVKNIFAPHCGMQIVLDYMENPLTEPNTSCLNNLKQINFRGNPLMALQVFGTWNMWEQ
jgi:pimeloyl-ACP methyl ester carboxylesterase